MERVTMQEAEVILEDWFSEHEGHEMDVNPGGGRVELWCEDCKEIRNFRVEGLREAAGEALRRDRAVNFG
jgi:hypothetical protein